MKASVFLQLAFIAVLTLPAFTAPSQPIDMDADATNDFSAVGNAIVELLKSRDVSRFVAKMAPTAEDFQSLVKNNEPANNLKGFQRNAVLSIKSSAQAVLTEAESLHLNFSTSNLYARVIRPESIVTTYFSAGGNPRDKSSGSPSVQRLEIVLTPDANAKPSPTGDFKIAVRGLVKFPSGWKSIYGIQWAEFPSTVADEKTRHALAILQMADGSRELTDEDDPALLQLANAVVHFIRERDIAVYQQDALPGNDEVFSLDETLMQAEPDAPRMTRRDFDSGWEPQVKEWLKSAGTVVDLLADSGVDLKNAQIEVTGASVKRAELIGPHRISLDGLQGEQFQIQFTVKSGGTSKNGTSLAGNCTLSAGQILRIGDNWKIIGNLRWDEMPDGVLDAKAAAKMQFESYVGQHGTLPPGTIAPDIEFTRLDNGQKMKLSDLRGKVVVLDFWATGAAPARRRWLICKPCREKTRVGKDRSPLFR